jgi:hypothetical protein
MLGSINAATDPAPDAVGKVGQCPSAKIGETRMNSRFCPVRWEISLQYQSLKDGLFGNGNGWGTDAEARSGRPAKVRPHILAGSREPARTGGRYFL